MITYYFLKVRSSFDDTIVCDCPVVFEIAVLALMSGGSGMVVVMMMMITMMTMMTVLTMRFRSDVGALAVAVAVAGDTLLNKLENCSNK